MNKRNVRLLILSLSLSLLVTQGYAATWSYEGYQTKATLKPGSEVKISTNHPVARNDSPHGGEISIWLQPVEPTTPAWIESQSNRQYLFRRNWLAMFQHNNPHNTEASSTLVVDLLDSQEKEKADSITEEKLKVEPERYHALIRFDINNNQEFEPEEIKEVVPLRKHNAWSIEANFEFASVSGPDGQPARFSLSLPGPEQLIKPTSFEAYYNQPYPPRLGLLLPTSARHLHSGREFEFRLTGNISPDRVAFHAFQVLETKNEKTEKLYEQLDLTQPFRLGDDWFYLAKIEPDLSSITIAQPVEGFAAPFIGRIGEISPNWARLDITTRDLFTGASQQDRQMVLFFSDESQRADYRYNGYRLLGDRIKAMTNDKAMLVVVENNIQYENFYSATAGMGQLNYRLIGSRDFTRNNDEKSSLNKIFSVAPNHAVTLLLSPGGIINLRKEKPLLDVLDTVIAAINGTQTTNAQEIQ